MSDRSGPSYGRMAFNTFGNYLFLAGTAAFSAWQWDVLGPLPLAVAGAIEALWITIGARTGHRRRYFDFIHSQDCKQLNAGRQQQIVRTLSEADRQRFLELERLAREIHEQVGVNSSMTMELVRPELDKIDKLLDVFLRLAATAARYEHYVDTSDLNQIDAEVRRQEQLLEKADEDHLPLARQNLDVLRRRLVKAVDIRKQLRRARGQLNLIDNTFRLLRDQILTMESPSQLQVQLDELTQAVDAIEFADRETEALVKKLDREISTLRG